MQPRLTRNEFIRLAAAAAPFALAPGALRAACAAGAAGAAPAYANYQVDLMVAADPHYLSPRLTDHGAFFQALIESSDGKVMRYSDELAEAFVATVAEESPDALVIAGDLTYNGARESHEDFAAKLARIQEAGVPVLVLPGNHDIDCTAAARFEGDSYELVKSVTPAEFACIYGAFGYDKALARDDASLSYVWEYAPELRFLFVDVNGVGELGTLPASTLAWVESQLEAASVAGARVVSFTHQSVLQQTFVAETYVIANAAELLELYGRFDVAVNFCGHLHVQHHKVEAGLAEMATSALCVAPCQYARVHLDVRADGAGAPVAPNGSRAVLLGLDYRTASLSERVSAWAQRQGSDDPNLLDFASYARTFFRGGDDGRNATILQLALNGFAEAIEMTDFMLDTNEAYFSGRLDLMEARPELIDLWLEANAVVGYYLMYVYQIAPVRNENLLAIPAL